MKQLTRERIYEIAGGNRSTYEIARAIEAEVLRINGQENEALRKALQGLADTFHEGRAGCISPGAEGYVSAALKAAEDALGGHIADATKMVGPSVDELRRQMREAVEAVYGSPGNAVSMPDLVAPHAPRANGCPDTMDDTARFAAEELPAFLKRQAS